MRVLFPLDAVTAQTRRWWWVCVGEDWLGTDVVLFLPTYRAWVVDDHLRLQFVPGEELRGFGWQGYFRCDVRYIPDDYPTQCFYE